MEEVRRAEGLVELKTVISKKMAMMPRMTLIVVFAPEKKWFSNTYCWEDEKLRF